MQIHTIKPKTKLRRSRRVGRGGKRGTYSGRGMKGQRSRSGARIRPQIRDLIKRIPKLRGDSARRPPTSAAVTISLSMLNKSFSEGESVTVKTLMEERLIKRVTTSVKIVQGGTPPKKLHVVGVSVSAGARETIEQAGGSVENKPTNN